MCEIIVKFQIGNSELPKKKVTAMKVNIEIRNNHTRGYEHVMRNCDSSHTCEWNHKKICKFSQAMSNNKQNEATVLNGIELISELSKID